MKQTQVSYPIPQGITHHPPPASFKTTLDALPNADSHVFTLRDGEVVLYKRKRSRVWQCKYIFYEHMRASQEPEKLTSEGY